MAALVPVRPVPCLAIALAIHLDGPGPVLQRQTRLGRGGREFSPIKFRTLIDGAEDLSGPVRASWLSVTIVSVWRFPAANLCSRRCKKTGYGIFRPLPAGLIDTLSRTRETLPFIPLLHDTVTEGIKKIVVGCPNACARGSVEVFRRTSAAWDGRARLADDTETRCA